MEICNIPSISNVFAHNGATFVQDHQGHLMEILEGSCCVLAQSDPNSMMVDSFLFNSLRSAGNIRIYPFGIDLTSWSDTVFSFIFAHFIF